MYKHNKYLERFSLIYKEKYLRAEKQIKIYDFLTFYLLIEFMKYLAL